MKTAKCLEAQRKERKRPALYALLLCACWMMACPKAAITPRPPTQAAKPKAEPKASESTFHTVVKGETLYGISRHYGVPLPELLAANQIRQSDILHIGERLRIPRRAVRPAAAASGNVGRQAAPPVAKGDIVLRWPVKGMLYAKFGKKGREVHDGIDLAAPLGTAVKAAAAGKVLYAGEQKGYGKIVILEHSAGVVTLYAHNHELRTQTGAEVAAGAIISTVGQSGRTSGPHLHFELRLNGIPVDPLPYLRPPP